MPEPETSPATEKTEKTEKGELRTLLRERLAATSPAAAATAAASVQRRVLALPELASGGGVLTCLSFGPELDTWGLAEALLAAGRELYVPRAESRSGRLHLHRYPCPLRTLSFGLRQPVREAPELPAEAVDRTIGAALLLGLGFDRRGYRLGYGAGYFDRFLAGRPFPAIGLAYRSQVLDRLPAEPHDVPMALVVTEAGLHRPR